MIFTDIKCVLVLLAGVSCTGRTAGSMQGNSNRVSSTGECSHPESFFALVFVTGNFPFPFPFVAFVAQHFNNAFSSSGMVFCLCPKRPARKFMTVIGKKEKCLASEQPGMLHTQARQGFSLTSTARLAENPKRSAFSIVRAALVNIEQFPSDTSGHCQLPKLVVLRGKQR